MIFIAVPGDSRCVRRLTGRDLADHRQARSARPDVAAATSSARTA